MAKTQPFHFQKGQARLSIEFVGVLYVTVHSMYLQQYSTLRVSMELLTALRANPDIKGILIYFWSQYSH